MSEIIGEIVNQEQGSLAVTTPLSGTLTRFAGLCDLKIRARSRVEIIGAGALGGWLALGLAKSGIGRLRVWDFDTVDAVNVGVQPYGARDIGQAKVTALGSRCSDWSGGLLAYHFVAGRFGSPESPGLWGADVTVSAVDSVEGRRLVFDAWKHLGCPGLFLDLRMAATEGEVWTAQAGRLRAYESALRSLETAGASVAPCTARGTAHNAMVIGGFGASVALRWIDNGDCGGTCLAVDMKGGASW